MKKSVKTIMGLLDKFKKKEPEIIETEAIQEEIPEPPAITQEPVPEQPVIAQPEPAPQPANDEVNRMLELINTKLDNIKIQLENLKQTITIINAKLQ